MLKACREIVGLKLLLLLLYGVNWTSCDIPLFLSLLCLFGLANYWRKNSDSNENEVIDWNDKLKVNRFSQHRGRIFLSNILQSRFSSLLYLYVQTCVACVCFVGRRRSHLIAVRKSSEQNLTSFGWKYNVTSVISLSLICWAMQCQMAIGKYIFSLRNCSLDW